MTKLRSLIFRELKICQKLYIIRFAVLFAFSAFVIVGTFLFTDLFVGMPENITESFTQMFSMLLILYSTVFLADDNTFKSDLNSGWNSYSYVLPITASERAAAKLIRFIGTLCISVPLGMVGVIMINKIAGTQFQSGYVSLQFIFLDLLLLSKIVMDFFVLRAKNTDEYKKMQDKGGLTCLASLVCAALAIMKCAGFDLAALVNSDSNEPFSLDILSMLTGGMLLWLIPLTLVLLAVHFAVIYHHSQYAYKNGAKTKKASVRAEKAIDLTAPHCEPVGFLYKEIRQNTKSIITVILILSISLDTFSTQNPKLLWNQLSKMEQISMERSEMDICSISGVARSGG